MPGLRAGDRAGVWDLGRDQPGGARCAAKEGPGSRFGGRRNGELRAVQYPERKTTMAIILAVLVLALILGGLGFAVHVLWWIALIVLVLWLLGFFFTGAASGGPRRRWYRW